MTGDHRLAGFAVPEGLDDLHGLLEQVGRDHPDLSPLDLSMFETAVIEIAGNVVEHGRPVGEVRWTFTVDVEPDRVVGELRDDGEEVGDVASAAAGPMPGVESESGRGLVLASAVLDELAYSRVGSTNVWMMVRGRS